ncbi:MAG: PAS domain-containing sensor histidine kinase [Nanoarchaeota archaeon]|nr:PAS domain-containing sensor histidine kinase [Nanoarchaeota archaeon]
MKTKFLTGLSNFLYAGKAAKKSVQIGQCQSEGQTLLIDTLENQIWNLTDKKTYGIVNKAHAKFLGLKKKELEGKNLRNIFSMKESCVFIANNKEVFKKKKKSHTEEWVKNGKGKPRLLSITRTPKLNYRGDVEYVTCAAEDITESKRIEASLLDSEEKFRLLAENSIDAIWILDRKMKFTYISPSSINVLGYKPEQMVGRRMNSFFKLKEFLRVGTMAAKGLKGFKGCTNVIFETKMLNNKNEEIDLEIASKVLRNDKGKIVGLQGATRVIRERRIAEKKLNEAYESLEIKVKERTAELEQAYNELKELDNQKDMFISIAAHELKTPLTTIQGFSQILRDKSISLDSKQKENYLSLINKNTQRLYNLILDLLDSTRLSLGKIKIDLCRVDVKDIFSETSDSMEIILKEEGIKPKFNLEKGIPKIMADSQRVNQVLRNLIINAVHATAKCGTISLTACRKGNLVQFEVKDTGIGISKHDQKYLFTKFYQADDSHRKKFTGSGLGLSICKGMVELMNGKIWFESKPGKGTTFYFTLPVAHKIKKVKR